MATPRFPLYCGLLLQLFVCGYAQYLTLTTQACNNQNVSINCNGKYINIQQIFYGALDVNTESVCPSGNDTAECCDRLKSGDCQVLYQNASFKNECQALTSCLTQPVTEINLGKSCDITKYKNVSAYVIVQYTCEDAVPTTTPLSTTVTSTTTVSTTTTTAPTTHWAPPTTTEYVNFLSMGAQAGIIVAIMVGLTIIFAAITVYKCVKYGPSDDTRKFFSKAPEPGAVEDPKIIPWVPGEAQEEIYRNITEKARAKAEAKAKRKRKFKF
ncbi:unnamed protein product [Lymnaea stagnalis]|uniref:Uncharacterized protein n=1 Tax=Lymnaea stagnalis TaxID=6523 RepID=A0AAV2HXT8_LYMST